MTNEIQGTPKGPCPAHVLVVGEAFGRNEEIEGIPFVGASGTELERMLEQAGFDYSQIRYTNIVNKRPPQNKIDKWFASSKTAAARVGIAELAGRYPDDIVRAGLAQLEAEIQRCAPEIIITLGDKALWALTGQSGITKWRGSLMQANGPAGRFPIPVVPTYHPAAILRQWSWRHIAVHDLRYASAQIPSPIPEPEWAFILRPTFEETMGHLDWILQSASQNRVTVAADIETRGGQIACLGIATGPETAICIPFLSTSAADGSYWSLDQEVAIIGRCARVLTHQNVEVVWQNGMYDLQYIARCWRFIANITDDTMIMQHSAFPGALPKGLDFLASMYCDYRYYWKDEGKDWDIKIPEAQLWRYNCLDACRTFEISSKLQGVLQKLGVAHVYSRSMSLHEPILFMVLDGVRVDKGSRARMAEDIINNMSEVQAWIDRAVGEPLNVKSPKQLQKLFYDQIGIPVIRHRQTGNPTLNEDALSRISKKHPILSPLVDRILAIRSASVFSGTFLSASIDHDDRIRCQFHIAGTETGRFASTKNAFGGGTNLENIPRPRDQDSETPILRFPNIRRLFIPDPGHVIADFDLDRADAHIVAWESGDEALKEMFQQGIDIHLANAFSIWNHPLPSIECLREDHPEYPKIKATWIKERQFAKNFCHGSNYGGKERSVAEAMSQVHGLEGITQTQVRQAQETWFNRHPAIQEWHEKTEWELMKHRQIETIFGRIRPYLDRIDYSILHQALAYKGQSPVADVINTGLRRVHMDLPWCHLLLQNHDSIVVQFPKDNAAARAEEIKQKLRVRVPYDDPLTIPVGYKMSETSWGDVR